MNTLSNLLNVHTLEIRNYYLTKLTQIFPDVSPYSSLDTVTQWDKDSTKKIINTLTSLLSNRSFIWFAFSFHVSLFHYYYKNFFVTKSTTCLWWYTTCISFFLLLLVFVIWENHNRKRALTQQSFKIMWPPQRLCFFKKTFSHWTEIITIYFLFFLFLNLIFHVIIEISIVSKPIVQLI